MHHIHGGAVPEPTALPLGFGLLLNLASLPGVADKDTAWRFVQRYAPGTSPETDPELDELIGRLGLAETLTNPGRLPVA